MKTKNNFFTKIFYFFIIVLILINGYFFYWSIKLGDEIGKYESKLEEIKNQNLLLEKEMSSVSSLDYIYKIAKKLSFSSDNKTLILENLVYAYKSSQ